MWKKLSPRLKILFLVLAGVFLLYKTKELFLQDFIFRLSSPFFWAQNLLVNSFQKTAFTVSNIFRLSQEIEILKDELSEKNLLLQKLKEVEDENVQLKDELKILKEKKKSYFLGAQVIARSPNSWTRSVVIDRGGIHGVTEKMPVFNAHGIIGKISKVNLKNSSVQLITDYNFRIGVRDRQSDILGLAHGDGYHLIVNFIPNDANVKIGDEMVSAGLSPLFPKGVLVGMVHKVEKNPQQLFSRILLKPAADLLNLKMVFIAK